MLWFTISAEIISLNVIGLRITLPSSCTASLVCGCLLLWSLGMIGSCGITETNGVHPCDITKINLGVNDRAHGKRKA